MQLVRETLPAHPSAHKLCKRVSKIYASEAAKQAQFAYKQRDYAYRWGSLGFFESCGSVPMEFFLDVMNGCGFLPYAPVPNCIRAVKAALQLDLERATELMLRLNWHLPRWAKEGDTNLEQWMHLAQERFLSTFAARPLTAQETEAFKAAWMEALKVPVGASTWCPLFVMRDSRLFTTEELKQEDSL